MEMNASYIKNIQQTDPGINTLCPDGIFVKSTHTVDLNCPNIPQDSAACHIFLILFQASYVQLESSAMLSVLFIWMLVCYLSLGREVQF